MMMMSFRSWDLEVIGGGFQPSEHYIAGVNARTSHISSNLRKWLASSEDGVRPMRKAHLLRCWKTPEQGNSRKGPNTMEIVKSQLSVRVHLIKGHHDMQKEAFVTTFRTFVGLLFSAEM